MTALQFLFLFLPIIVYPLSWTQSKPLPTYFQGAAAPNRNFTYLYLFSCQHGVYQYDGSNYILVSSVETDTVDQYSSTTINDIFYQYGSYHGSMEFKGYNTTSLDFANPTIIREQNRDNDYPLGCMASNHTHLILLYQNIVDITYGKSFISTYDIITGSWSSYNISIWVMGFVYCQYYNHNVYMFGCFSTKYEDYSICDDNSHNMIMKYNDISNTAEILPKNLTFSSEYGGISMPNNDGMIYIIGGDSGIHFTTFNEHVDLFNANDMSVTQMSPLLVGRDRFMYGFMQGEIYVMGGSISPSPNQFPDSNTTEKSSFIPTMRPTKSPTLSPTHSPTHSPSLPTISPSKPTSSPTDMLNLHISEQEIIYFASAVFALLFCSCIGVKCWKRRRNSENVYQDEGRRYSSIGGLGARIQGRNIMDTSSKEN
eukprot:34752_1